MNIDIVPLKKIKPGLARLRHHGRRHLKTLARSLERFGQQKPVVVDEQDRLLAGHGVLATAGALGWTHLAIVRSTLSGHEAAAYAIADNRCAELSSWREKPLAERLASLQTDEDRAAQACGFDEREMQRLADHAAGLAVGTRRTATHRPVLAALMSRDEAGARRPRIAPASAGQVVFQLLVSCHDEADQRQLYEALAKGGYACRVLTL